MELTPTLLVAIGDAPEQGLRRFKQESVWRPGVVRRIVRALFLGALPAQPEGPLARVLGAWTDRECHWVGPGEAPRGSEAELARVLGDVQEATRAAGLQDRIHRTPGYSIRNRDHREWFAPEVLVLADSAAVTARDLAQVAGQISERYQRPVSILLTLPAPTEEGWAQVRGIPRELLNLLPPEQMARLWLVSRERESGELLGSADVADALSHFCHLFAYGGWSGNPALDRLLVRPVEGRRDHRLATFGVRGYRYGVASALREHALQTTRARIARQLATPANAGEHREADELSRRVVRGREMARERIPDLPGPDRLGSRSADGGMEAWLGSARVHWLPEVARLAREGMEEGLGRAAIELLAGAASAADRLGRLQRLEAALRTQLEAPAPVLPLSNLAAAAERLAAVRTRQDRWVPLLLKAMIMAIVAGSFAWTFVSPAVASPASVLTLAAWIFFLVIRYLVDRREHGAALAGVRSETARWAAAQTEGVLYAETNRQLQHLRRQIAGQIEREQEGVKVLAEALELLSPEQGGDDPARSALTVPVGGPWTPAQSLPPLELPAPGIAPLPVVESLLREADLAGEHGVELSGEVRQALLSRLMEGAREDPGWPSLLLPIRRVHPVTGETVPTVSLVLEENPFLLQRFVITEPFGLSASPRTDGEGREEL